MPLSVDTPAPPKNTALLLLLIMSFKAFVCFSVIMVSPRRNYITVRLLLQEASTKYNDSIQNISKY